MRKIMRTTLHDHAPNTYSGQWSAEKTAVCGPRTSAIAHNELAASARIVAFLVRSEISQGIARRCVGNLYVDQKENAPGDRYSCPSK
jgi:hypothetical protein